MFINFEANSGFSINSYRKPGGYANSDVTGLVDDILSGFSAGSCPLEGAKAALEDGSLWQNTSAVQEIIEDLHALICEYERETSNAAIN